MSSQAKTKVMSSLEVLAHLEQENKVQSYFLK